MATRCAQTMRFLLRNTHKKSCFSPIFTNMLGFIKKTRFSSMLAKIKTRFFFKAWTKSCSKKDPLPLQSKKKLSYF